MAEFFGRAVEWVRSLASGLDWAAVRDHPAWAALWKTAASPEGAALIATTFAALGLGIFVGYLWGRPRATAGNAVAPPPVEDRLPAPEAAAPEAEEAPPADAAPAALRAILRQRGLEPAVLDARIAAFRADLAAGRTTLGELAAVADPADETDAMIATATKALERGEFAAAIDALDRGRCPLRRPPAGGWPRRRRSATWRRCAPPRWRRSGNGPIPVRRRRQAVRRLRALGRLPESPNGSSPRC